MTDLAHYWGSDLTLAANGDLLVATETTEVNQRILRALMTAPGDYLFHMQYGVGVGQYVGKALTVSDYAKIRAAVRSIVLRDPDVAQTPAPKINFRVNAQGYVLVSIPYTYKPSGQLQTLTFTVSK